MDGGSVRNSLATAGLKDRAFWVYAPTVLGVLIVIALFSNSAWSMVRIWTESATYGHGYIVPPAALVMAWRRRHALNRAPRRLHWLGLVPLLAGCGVWYVGYLTDTNLLLHISVVLLVHAVVVLTLGVAAYRVLAFPLIFLVLAIPFGDFAITWLQQVTADWSVAMLRWSGITVYQEAWLISVPGGVFRVTDVCAGLRYVLAAFTLCLLVGEMFFQRLWMVLAYGVFGIAVAIVANAVRAYGVILLAYSSGFKLAMGVDHIIYGWFFFGLIATILVLFGAKLADLSGAGQVRRVAAVGPAWRGVAPMSVWGAAVAVCACLAVQATGDYRLARIESRPPLTTAPLPPDAGSAWRLVPREAGWQGRFVGPDVRNAWSFQGRDGGIVTVQLALWSRELPGRKMVSVDNQFGDGWNVVESGTASVLEDGRPTPVAYWRVHSDAGQRLVYFWYWVDGRLVATPWQAKLLQAKVRLLGGPGDAGLLAVSTRTRAGDASTATLEQFLSKVNWLDYLQAQTAGRR